LDQFYYRMRGELLMKAGAEGDAEKSLRQAIEIATRKGAKMWQLQAINVLARLLAGQGRRDEARAMLAEIYSWFTEGFNTADLKEAKAPLDEVSG
jgi:predicted ATPase